MNLNLQTAIRHTLCLTAVATLIGCAENQAVARQETPAPQAVETATAVAEPTDAKALLMRMAEYLAKSPKFTVNLIDHFDVTQESGQKIEFAESRKIVVSRPNGLRVDLEESNGNKHVVYYDGKDITVFSPKENVYAQTSKTGGIDEAIKYFLKDLHMRLPLAALLISSFPSEVEKRTQSLEYVEKTSINGVPSHHLAGRTETVDFQVWIAESVQPLPQRIVLTYKNADGQPQFSAEFSDWNLSPQIDDAQFAFTPPEGSRKIAFLAQLPALVPGASELPAHPGEKQ
jgi:hypothetical protein